MMTMDLVRSTGGSDCLGDLDGDGVAATADLLLFLSVFGSTCN